MFVLSEELLELQAAAKEAAEQILAKSARSADEEEHFDKQLFHQLGQAGLCGIPTSEELGGLGLGYLEYAVAIEEIAKVSASYAVTVAVNGLPQIILAQFGTAEQQEKYTERLALGEWLALSRFREANSGSDAGSLKTKAVRDGDQWVSKRIKDVDHPMGAWLICTLLWLVLVSLVLGVSLPFWWREQLKG